MNTQTHYSWQHYCETELLLLAPLLARRGYVLADDQPHLKGERFLMQAATTKSGVKLILFGHTKDAEEVVIKATRNLAGQAELKHERRCRDVLHQLKFAAEVFHTPPEVAWFEDDGFVVSVQRFIPQTSTFLERPLKEQFRYALAAFKAQEGTHATTASHRRLIAGVYEERHGHTYLTHFDRFVSDITDGLPEAADLHQLLETVSQSLHASLRTIEQYTGFLTHTDFVPHNIRIDADGVMYLLDHSSLTFGNKHEGWARFINFMTLYNPPLANALVWYMEHNRAPEELASLKLMRLYRLCELIWYYQNKLPLCEGDLFALNHARVFFWAKVLESVLADRPVSNETLVEYQNTRDRLRSQDERRRQLGLH